MNKDILEKPNGLVVIKNVLTKNEHKIYNVLLKRAFDSIDKEVPKWEINYADLKELSGIKRNEDIKNAFRGLARSEIVIKDFLLKKGQESWAELNTSFIAGWGYDKNEEQLRFSFDPFLHDLLKNDFVYAQISFKALSGLTNKHSLWLFELINDYKYIGSRELTIEQIRILAGLKEHQYKSTAELKRAVIDKAVKEIKNKTSFSLEYDVKKQGRNIESFIFKFRDNNPDIIKRKKQFRAWVHEVFMHGRKIEIPDLNINVQIKSNEQGQALVYDFATNKPIPKKEALGVYDWMYDNIEKITWNGRRGEEALDLWIENQKGLF